MHVFCISPLFQQYFTSLFTWSRLKQGCFLGKGLKIRRSFLVDRLLFYVNRLSHITATSFTFIRSHVCASVSSVLGSGSDVSCSRTLPQKAHRFQRGLNSWSLGYNSYTLLLSHAGPCLLPVSSHQCSRSVLWRFKDWYYRSPKDRIQTFWCMYADRSLIFLFQSLS